MAYHDTLEQQYLIPPGYLPLRRVFCHSVGYDTITIVRANRWGRMVVRFFGFLDRWGTWIAQYDHDSLDLKKAQFYPWWSGSWWWFLPYRFINRYAQRAERRWEGWDRPAVYNRKVFKSLTEGRF